MNVKELAKMFTAVPEMGIWTAESHDPAKLKKTMEVCNCTVPAEEVIAFIDTDVLTRKAIQGMKGLLYKVEAKIALHNGVVVTPTAIYCCFLIHGFKYTFREGMKIQYDDECLWINGTEFCCLGTSDMYSSLKKFFEELQNYIQQMKPEEFDPRVVNNPHFNLAKTFTPDPYNHIFIYPDIDETRLAEAIKQFAPEVSPAEVLVFVDESLSGSGKSGVLLTRTKLYSKGQSSRGEIWLRPKFFTSAAVTLKKGMKFTAEKDVLYIDGAKIIGVTWSSENVSRFAAELQKYTDALEFDENAAGRYFTHDPGHCIYASPDIPKDKLAAALSRFASTEAEKDVLLLVDNSWGFLGNCLLLTASKLYVRDVGDKNVYPVRKDLKIAFEGKNLLINGEKVLSCSGIGEVPQMQRVVPELQKYVAEHGAVVSENECVFTPAEKIHVAPAIPQKKLNNAIQAYANGVSPQDVLLLLDKTAFGSGKEGLLLTASKLYVKYLGDAIVYPVRNNLKITLEGKELQINGAKVLSFIESEVPQMQRVVPELQKYVAEHGAVVSENECVFTPTKRIHIAPAIPQKKLNNAIQAYANSVSSQDVLLLLDNTAFGSGKEGLLLTASKLYVKSVGDAIIYPVRNNLKITLEGKELQINGAKVLSFIESEVPQMQQLALELQKYANSLN